MEDVKEIIRAGIERWNAHDREGFLDLFDDEVAFVNEPTGEELKGREEFGKGFYDMQTEAYPDTELKDLLILAEGNTVFMTGSFTGTHTGVMHAPIGDLPPTGKHVKSPFAFVAEVHDSKVKRARMFYDRLLTLEQEGVVTPDVLIHLPVAQG